ncbi:methyltransferase domain-containing protein [Candidatus Woesearchaeota archaeon]|nr:MAG: methyltransferase domain-containing protein [Candidatus Woesearchaeota archaeon]
MDIYEPQEDSFFIKEYIKEYATGNVLDMGTGSGILAEEAAKYAKSVIAVDINPKAIEHCKKNINNPKILFVQSNLFQVFELGLIHRTFDLIIFNPPYLPKDKYPDVALDGGKEGYEVIEKFLRKAKTFLNPKGKILILFSSLSQKQKIDNMLKHMQFKFEQIARKKLAFEELYLYLIT